MLGGVEFLNELNLLHHVGVVAKRLRAAAAWTAHEGDENTPLRGKNGVNGAYTQWVEKLISLHTSYNLNLFQRKWARAGSSS